MRAMYVAVTMGAVLLSLGSVRDQTTPAHAASRHPEVRRLQAHFDSVDRELNRPAHPTDPVGQHARRTQLRAWLRAYRDAAAFPRNWKHPGATPIFRDDSGALCAVAYLIARSGRSDLVAAIADTRNYAYVRDLAGHAGLRAWLDSVGLSVAEAARIQPAYASGPSVSFGYVVGTVAADVLAVWSTGVMLASPERKTAWMGAVSGGLALALGVGRLRAENGDRRLARWNVALGVGTLAVSAVTFRVSSSPPPSRERERATAWQWSPVLAARQEGPRVGVQVRRAF